MLNDPDGEVAHGMSTLVEVFSYWGLLVSYVISIVVEAFMQSPCCLTDIFVIITLFAFDQMDFTLGLAGSRCLYLVGFIGVSWAFDSAAGLNMLAGLTPFLVAWAGSSIFCDGNNRLNLCASWEVNDGCMRKHADQGHALLEFFQKSDAPRLFLMLFWACH